MRIGIFETEHFEGAYPVIQLFDNGKNDITIFTYEKSFRQFQFLFKDRLERYDWLIKNKSASKYFFIYQIYKTSKKNKFDILYLNTVTDNHIFYFLMIAALRKTRIILTLHDINSHFVLTRPLGMRKIVRFIGKKCLISIVKEFNVVSSTMVDYLKKKLPLHKKVHCVPGSVFEEIDAQKNYCSIIDHIEVVVPGTVDARRRNYEFIFCLLEGIHTRNLNISITLLGAVDSNYGNQIYDKCIQYSLTKNNLRFFDTTIVDQPEFDRSMNQAHIVLIPSVINTVIADDVSEIYGISISSGNLFDVIKHAKPFIIPVQLQIPANLETSAYRYSSADDILYFLECLLTQPDRYPTLNAQAIKNSRDYTIENVRRNNSALFKS